MVVALLLEEKNVDQNNGIPNSNI